ncbi:MAG: hypothetical protein KIT09_17045 [Bryobacteraceae bacterium]|nr:hypothetical protein [Bryobacteraceae bacterium]
MKANSVSISGSASVTFVAGNCIQLSPGFRATAGTAATTFRAWLQNPPTADSASPSSGSGLTQTFTWKASSSPSYTNLAEMQALFHTSVSFANACYIRYNRTANRLYLRNNTDTSWLGNFAPGTSGTASNSQCSISGTGASASGVGNQLTLTVPVTFQASFSGTKNDYLFAQDNAGLTSGWQPKGTWTVGAGSNPKTTITTNPANLQFKVDGITYNSQTDFFWTPGSSHTIQVPTFQGTVTARRIFDYWSPNLGRAARYRIAAPSSATTYTANFSPPVDTTPKMQGPTWLEVNLSYMPFDHYYDDASHMASQYGFPTSCPAGSTIRGCFKTVLADLRRQGVSGVRIFFGLCGESGSTPLSGCALLNPTQGGTWRNVSGPHEPWKTNVANFFRDVSDADIQNIILSPAHPSYPVFAVPKSQTTTPMGSDLDDHCDDTQNTVYFNPMSPFGRKAVTVNGEIEYRPVGQDQPFNRGYNCAPINPHFVGWQHHYDVLDFMLSAAAQTEVTPSGKRFTVSELDFEQELNVMNFPVLARFINDNAQTDSGISAGGLQEDVGDALGDLMASYNFDPLRVTWSAPWTGVQQDASYHVEEFDCPNVWEDMARNMGIDQIASAINGTAIGKPSPPFTPYLSPGPSTGYLHCKGSFVDMHDMPGYGPQRTILDFHVRPELHGAGAPPGGMVQGEAKADFNAIRHHLYHAWVRQDAIVVLGETWSNPNSTIPCETGPADAAKNTVAGYNASQLKDAGRTVIFRPWMQLQLPSGICFTYPDDQKVNFNWLGPYGPANF